MATNFSIPGASATVFIRHGGMMGDLSVEIFSSATGVTKIDVFHPDPIEQLWHGSRVLDYWEGDTDAIINNYPGYVNGGDVQ